MDLAVATSQFLTQLRADGRSSHTVGQYQRHLRRFARTRTVPTVSRRADGTLRADIMLAC